MRQTRHVLLLLSISCFLAVASSLSSSTPPSSSRLLRPSGSISSSSSSSRRGGGGGGARSKARRHFYAGSAAAAVLFASRGGALVSAAVAATSPTTGEVTAAMTSLSSPPLPLGVWATVAVALPVLTLSVILRNARRRAARASAVDSSFRGKVVWVTGASSGIGRALALAFAEKGAKLVLSARREAELRAVAAECAAAASTAATAGSTTAESVARVLPFDLAEDPAALLKKGAAAAKLWGADGVDILVNNGGISSRSAAELTTIDVDQRVMAIDYLAPVALTKGVLPAMLARASSSSSSSDSSTAKGVGAAGHVVVVSSVQGRLAIPFRTSYAAAKHALHGFFESLRAEVAGRGVKVTMVCPGYVKTSLSLNAVTGSGGSYAKMDANTAKGMEPSALAADILAAVAAGDHEVMACDLKTKAAVLARALLPGPLAGYMVSRAKKGWKDQQ